MDMNTLILRYGEKLFNVDLVDELGAYMFIDEYKIHVRGDDINLVKGLSIRDIQPLIDSLSER